MDCLAEIAACPSETIKIRVVAVRFIGCCGFAQFADLLASILADWEGNPRCASSAATALGSLDCRKHMPLLAEVARKIGATAEEYSEQYFLRRECITSIYLALFDDHERGPMIRRDALAWWERVHPTRLDVEGWLYGLNVPEDDGMGHPRRPGWE